MEKYVRITRTLNDKGRFVKLSEVENQNELKNILAEAPKTDWYRSLYCYSEDAVKYFEENNSSIAGYNGRVFTDKLLFDLDSEDLEKAKKDATELLYRLHDNGIDVGKSVRVYFSGGKGFHIEVPVKAELEPDELKSICTNLAVGLETFDPKVYNINRIIRLPNTKHQHTGRYKTEILPHELTEQTIEQIKERSEKDPTFENFVVTAVEDSSFLEKFKTVTPKQVAQVVVDANEDGVRGMDTVNFEECPKTKPRCIHALEHGVMVPGLGERNDIFFALARYYRNQGFTKEVTHNLLKGIARENARLYPEADPYKKEEIWNTVVKSVYSGHNKNWKTIAGASGINADNTLIAKYCDLAGKHTNRACSIHGKKQEQSTTVQIDEVFTSFDNFASNFDKNTVKTGIGFIDDNMKIVTGTTTLLVGAAGSGKTTVALNVLENANAFDQESVFFSLDMHKNLVYLKLAMKLTNYSKDQIFAFHKTKDSKKIEYIRDAISEKYSKTHFDFSSILTLDQMRDKVYDIEQKCGNKIKFVLTDYAGRIAGPFSDRYANSTYNALKSVEVANATDAAWIILSQISRNVGDGCTPIRTKRAAKESGDWEESATNVITIWRPFMGDQSDRDDVMRMFMAKNRMGPELEAVLHWNGSKSIVRDMTFDELADYNETRGEKVEKDYLKARLNKT